MCDKESLRSLERQRREHLGCSVYASEVELLKPLEYGRQREKTINEPGRVVLSKVQRQLRQPRGT